MTDAIIIEHDGPITRLILNRPDKLNSLTIPMLGRLEAVIDECENDGRTRVLVIRAAGRAFCAGVDLGLTSDALADRDAIDDVVSTVHRTLHRIETSPLVSIAVVHGLAVAGGLELTMACDVAVAADDAKLGDFHARYGLFPGGGASQRLPRLIGERRAKWLLLSAEMISGAVAADWGLVTESVAGDKLDDRIEVITHLLAQRSPALAGVIKQTVQAGSKTDLWTALADERPLFLGYMTSKHARIGLQAFETRTEPEFPNG